MRAGLQLRQSAHLALTPQLQQSIRLLQLSTLELQQEIQQMLDQNPLLELQDEDEGSPPPEGLLPDRLAEVERADSEETERELVADDFERTEHDDWSNGTEGDDFDGIAELPSRAPADEGGDDRPEAAAPLLSLMAHLEQQTAGLNLADEDRAALRLLMGCLDERGYLVEPLESLAEDFSRDEALDEVLDRLRIALALLQSLDPVGVGARSLPECLSLQLRQHGDHPQLALARTLCMQHLEVLARKDWRRLTQLTGAPVEALREALGLITRLEPHPGRAFAAEVGVPVVPDVLVRRQGRGWRVRINPAVRPRIGIHAYYAQCLRQNRGSPLVAQLQEARGFLKSIEQRLDTIERVAQAIVDRQSGFLQHGELAMRPLVLREIAEELGLHESTVSRVTTAKYMATPQGVFELKYFFGSGLSTETGGETSSTAVRALIRQFIEAEDAAKPLSDQTLAEMLEAQGIQCARRTVAKYREALKIPVAAHRKN
ncbi:RNA polymerase factor sigma-54 [Inhella gelatinilytica]|uniref:RNA polymerase sigma-54 factor n=1 Tax=Inhella gelatinilytica TaxID=2795030 RepID=A0A931NC39_9BURK|nr:RNA polymerase factor sigma-54 [Inhella gelatinilytica]MBH9551582.1 RNA polymerase factor sigma-54 [Inhella gelatinilytica]